jgi:acid phosphatase
MDNDDFNTIPANVSTVVDLLDTKGISWGEYQENLPYAGFQGFNYSNQISFNNSYVRKHNPLIIYESVVSNATRLSLIKNFTSFNSDLAAQTLPQCTSSANKSFPLFPFECSLGTPRTCSYLWFLVLLFQKNLPLTSGKGSFITPNMTDDGHDTDVTFAANWARGFLTPLLNNSYFMNNTLVVLTFDEDETYTGTSSTSRFYY